jgi:myo-inositol 2-dehydrogenase / D-chiro-inositol 1-dehydrogenase
VRAEAGFDVPGQQEAPIRVGVIGTGRIGWMHARLLASGAIPALRLAAVSDVNADAASACAARLGIGAVALEQMLARDDIDAVAICSSTGTHAELSMRAAKAGKAVFCEKPLSLDLAEVDHVLAAVDGAAVPFMVGFNRRFDPAHEAVRAAVTDGRLGDLRLVRITSRDPAPPPPEYVRVSAGIFLDMTIHDFDMARYITGQEVVEVYARSEVRVDPGIGAAGDLDTAVVVLTHAGRTLTVIDNSREAVYGFDQRVEAFGSGGMAVSENPRVHTAVILGRGEATAQPLPWFFHDRYLTSYRRGWAAFARYVRSGGTSPVPGRAARAAVTVDLAAGRSAREGRPVRLAEIS